MLGVSVRNMKALTLKMKTVSEDEDSDADL